MINEKTSNTKEKQTCKPIRKFLMRALSGLLKLWRRRSLELLLAYRTAGRITETTQITTIITRVAAKSTRFGGEKRSRFLCTRILKLERNNRVNRTASKKAVKPIKMLSMESCEIILAVFWPRNFRIPTSFTLLLTLK